VKIVQFQVATHVATEHELMRAGVRIPYGGDVPFVYALDDAGHLWRAVAISPTAGGEWTRLNVLEPARAQTPFERELDFRRGTPPK